MQFVIYLIFYLNVYICFVYKKRLRTVTTCICTSSLFILRTKQAKDTSNSQKSLHCNKNDSTYQEKYYLMT